MKINIKTLLEDAINARKLRLKNDPLLPPIDPAYTQYMLEKLDNRDFKNLFQTMKYELLNNYGVEIEWEAKSAEVNLILKNVKNIHANLILNKLSNFTKWFAESQLLCK